MADLGDPIRVIEVIPGELPVPLEKPEQPALPELEPLPEKVGA